MSVNTEPQFTLKGLAQMGYTMGLSTIAECAINIELHYDLFWKMEDVARGSAELQALIAGHENDSIDVYLTPADKKAMDDEEERILSTPPADGPFEDFP